MKKVVFLLSFIFWSFFASGQILLNVLDTQSFSHGKNWQIVKKEKEIPYLITKLNLGTDKKHWKPNHTKALWSFSVKKTGTYEIFAFIPELDKPLAEWSCYEINTATGKKYKIIDQNQKNWISLGTYSFLKDKKYNVILNVSTSYGKSTSYVVASSLKIVKKDELPPVKIKILSFPAKLKKGEKYNLDFSYKTNIYQTNDSGRFIVEIYDLNSSKLIKKIVKDNDLKGYSGPEGKISITFVSPQNVEFPGFLIYFSLMDMNEYFIKYAETLPRDGSIKYRWRGGDGVTTDVSYKGCILIKNKEPQDKNTAFCCGLTFETFIKGFEIFNKEIGNKENDIWNLSLDQMKDFFHKWYIQEVSKGFWWGPTDAITYYKMGFQITDFHKLKKGDFCQIWRKKGSGHSVIVNAVKFDKNGKPIALCYWSVQGSTNGINFNVESWNNLNFDTNYFKKYPKKVTTFVRCIRPVSVLDWENKIGFAYTDAKLLFIKK